MDTMEMIAFSILAYGLDRALAFYPDMVDRFSLEKAKSKDQFAWGIIYWIMPLSWLPMLIKYLFNKIKSKVDFFRNLPEL